MGSVDGLDAIPEILSCPICMDVPLKKVFQCGNGHLLCEECYAEGFKLCPTCRLPFDSEPIRSLAVETLLKRLPFHINCLYETSGCKMRMDNLKSYRDHVQCCGFGPFISICEKLGFPDCTFKMNGGTKAENVIDHFETTHGAWTRDSDRIEVEFLNYASLPGGTKLCILILNQKEKGYACVIRVQHEEMLKWTPFYLRYPTLGHPSGVDTDLHHFITSSLPFAPKPDVTFHHSQPLLDPLNYSEPSLANHDQQDMKNKSILKCLTGTSGSLVVSVEVRKFGNVSWNMGQVPRIKITPGKMKGITVPELGLDLPRNHLEAPPLSIADIVALSRVSLSGSQGPAESTVSLKLNRIPDILLCPVCRELPISKVFQCRKGHILCGECRARQERCPQCKIGFDNSPIRSRAVEMLLDKLIFEMNCRYEVYGCTERLGSPKSFREHVKFCEFRSGRRINVCKALGFETCPLQMNPMTTVEEAIQHFETQHGAGTGDSDKVQVRFSDLKRIGGAKLIILNQKLEGYACLILARHVSGSPQKLNWAPFYLQYPTLGTPVDYERAYLKTSSLSVDLESKVEFEYSLSQPALDILRSPNQGPLLNLYEMMTVEMLKQPFESVFVRTKAKTEIVKSPAGANLERSNFGTGAQNPLGDPSRFSIVKASSSWDVSNPNDVWKGASAGFGDNGKKRSLNSKSDCVIV